MGACCSCFTGKAPGPRAANAEVIRPSDEEVCPSTAATDPRRTTIEEARRGVRQWQRDYEMWRGDDVTAFQTGRMTADGVVQL
jgi:hypothetical protein